MIKSSDRGKSFHFPQELMNPVEKLDSVSEETARRLNLGFSTVAGAIFLYMLVILGSLQLQEILAGSIMAAIFDFSTVHFVHSGVISETFRQLSHPKKFMRLHVGSGVLGYIFLASFLISGFFLQRIDFLYYIFMASWGVTYVSGLYSYLSLKRTE